MNVVLFIICVIIAGSAMLRIAELSVNSANLHFVQILLNSTQPIIIQDKNRGQQYDNSM